MAINTWFVHQPATGSGQYVRHLLEGLARLDPEGTYVLCGPPVDTPAPNQTVRPFSAQGDLAKVWFEQVTVPMASRGLDLVHYPYFAAPLRSPTPVVVTVHDLVPLLPAYGGSARVRAYTALVSGATRRAAMVITDSQASKVDIVEKLGIPDERIRVVLLGVEGRFHPAIEPARLAGVRQRLGGLRHEFVLYLGGLEQRKNVGALLMAFAQVRQQLADPPALVIAGCGPEEASLRDLARRLELREAVHFVGAVPEEEKPALYSAARLFVFPSLYEGFGLPPLEAMACGTPVVCSNASSLPEVVGDAGLLLDGSDADALAEAICRALVDDALRRALRQRGLARAAQLTWEETARRTLEVYREVAGR